MPSQRRRSQRNFCVGECLALPNLFSHQLSCGQTTRAYQRTVGLRTLAHPKMKKEISTGFSYIVRDENAQVLSAAELNTLYEQLPKAIGTAHSYVSEVSFKDDGKSYHWPESAD